jgi:hypothetical protein
MAEATPRRLYQLRPVADQHRDESRRFILEAANAVSSGKAIVLGAGECTEIPLQELVERFDHLTLNDLDAGIVEAAVVACDLNEQQMGKIEIEAIDLTGLADIVVSAVAKAVEMATDPQSALAAMADAVDKARPVPVRITGPFELVVASCLLGQLHVMALHRAQAEFLKRFPGQEALLQTTRVWSEALERMARRMEEDFIDHLFQWTTPAGRIYLSETVRIAFLEPGEQGGWQSEGNYRMLKSAQLADYLDERFVIESQRGWQWVFKPPQNKGDRGRLFEVQAMVLTKR